MPRVPFRLLLNTDDCVDDIAYTLCDEQYVGGNANIAVTFRGNAELRCNLRREIKINYVARQGLPDLPLFCLSGWHTAIVLSCKTGRATCRAGAFAVVLTHRVALMLLKARSLVSGLCECRPGNKQAEADRGCVI